jgi:hypothetical protein
MSLTKINNYGQLVFYLEFNTLLPTHIAGYWIVHKKISYLLRGELTDIANEIIQQAEITRVAGVATGTAAALAGLILLLGVGNILNALLGSSGNGGDPPPSVYVIGIQMSINENRDNLNCLSTNSTLSINTLNYNNKYIRIYK